MNCPRCGEKMSFGVCDNCGFPITRKTLFKTLMTKKINRLLG